jgi:hypothetical protein
MHAASIPSVTPSRGVAKPGKSSMWNALPANSLREHLGALDCLVIGVVAGDEFEPLYLNQWLKKCVPMICSGCAVADAISVTGSDDVFVLSTTPGSAVASNSLKTDGPLQHHALGDGLITNVSASSIISRPVVLITFPNAASASVVISRVSTVARRSIDAVETYRNEVSIDVAEHDVHVVLCTERDNVAAHRPSTEHTDGMVYHIGTICEAKNSPSMTFGSRIYSTTAVGYDRMLLEIDVTGTGGGDGFDEPATGTDERGSHETPWNACDGTHTSASGAF